MKTARGSNYDMLLTIHVEKHLLTLPLTEPLDIETSFEYLQKMRETIAARIILGTRPAGTLQKELERIAHHKDQLLDAYKGLFRCYRHMIEPQTRVSAAYKAKSDMLNCISDMKLLRGMCAITLGDKADDYVLPADRLVLIADTLEGMAAADAKANAKLDAS